MKQCQRCYRTYENTADRCTLCGNQLVLLPENAANTKTFAGNYAANDVRSRFVNTVDLSTANATRPAGAEQQRNHRHHTAAAEAAPIPEPAAQNVQNGTVRERTRTRNFASYAIPAESPVREHRTSIPPLRRQSEAASSDAGRTARQIRPERGRMQDEYVPERSAEEMHAYQTPPMHAEMQTASSFRRDPMRTETQPNGTLRRRGRRRSGVSIRAVFDMLLRYILPVIALVTAVVFVVMNWNMIASVLSTFALFWVIGFCVMLCISRGFGGLDTLMVGSTVIAVIGMLLYYNIANISGGLYCLIMGLMPSVIILAVIFYLVRSVLRP